MRVASADYRGVELKPGAYIANRYRLEQCIGHGGHAQIWTAIDDIGNKRVALKFLHPDSCSAAQAWDVLWHEAQIAWRMDHPGVLRPGTPQRDGDFTFLPLEFAGGSDATALRCQSYQRVVPVLISVAAILDHAHSRGIVHRDIKPGNVLVDAQGAVRLVDFATAATLGTTGGLAPGSPFNASPQQLRGEPATVADDVYGLGAMAYELLGGYPPGYPDFDPERVQTSAPTALQPLQPAPPGLITLIMQMLERDPARRPADMREVAEALAVETRASLRDEAVVAGDSSDSAVASVVTSARASVVSAKAALLRWIAGDARRVWVLLALVAVLLLLVGGMAWMRVQQSQAVLREQVLEAYSQGLEAEQAGNRQSAVARFDEALSLDAQFEPAREARARVLTEQRRIVEGGPPETASPRE